MVYEELVRVNRFIKRAFGERKHFLSLEQTGICTPDDFLKMAHLDP